MSAKPTVLLDCTSAAKPKRGGIQNYIINLVTALRRREDEFSFVVVIRAGHMRARRYLVDLAPEGVRVLVPVALRQGVLLHALGVRLPALRLGIRTVATIHDVGVFDVPELYSEKWILRRRSRIRQTVRRADGIAVPAAYTAGRIRELFPWFRGHIAVTAEGVDLERFSPEARAEDEQVLAELGLKRPFVLQVGALAPRKDPLTTLRAFAGCKEAGDFDLVMPGEGSREYVERIRKEAESLGVARRLKLIGFVEPGALPALYRRCTVFVFPSRYEGFGLPVLEAMACGAPAVLARIPCVSEVAGPAACYFEPGAHHMLSEILGDLLRDAGRRERLRAEGIARSRCFTWDRTAESTAELYRKILSLP